MTQGLEVMFHPFQLGRHQHISAHLTEILIHICHAKQGCRAGRIRWGPVISAVVDVEKRGRVLVLEELFCALRVKLFKHVICCFMSIHHRNSMNFRHSTAKPYEVAGMS